MQIPFSRGVCGAAVRTGAVQLVKDVDSFEGLIACASSTGSEIVLPVHNAQGIGIAVLDIDSDQPAAFDQGDAEGLTQLLKRTFAR